MVNDIEVGKNKISVWDKIAFSCEQEYRRKEQQLQELIKKRNNGKVDCNDFKEWWWSKADRQRKCYRRFIRK